MTDVTAELQWMVIFGGFVAFTAAFGIGANDVANAFATSIGAKTLSLKQAILIAAVFEFCGAFFMGAHVTSTIRKGIIDADAFEGRADLLILAMFSALISTTMWLLLATKLSLPVSTTHTIVGGILGAGIAYGGVSAVKWSTVWLIVASWVVSPLLSGLIALAMFAAVRSTILRKPDSCERGFRFYPMLVVFTVAVNMFFIIFKGTPALDLDETPLWLGILVSLGIGCGAGILVYFLLVPTMRKRVEMKAREQKPVQLDSALELEIPESPDDSKSGSDESNESKISMTTMLKKKFNDRFNQDLVKKTMDEHKEVESMHEHAEKFDAKTEHLFSYLQVFTAVFDSFAHGSNDVANSIAPFAAMYAIYTTGDVASKSEVPAWILALGGAGIICGLTLWGYHIICAIGVRLTKITPSRGFSIELGAAAVVVMASRIGIPVSTTHCQVGATVFVGAADGVKNVNWKVMLQTAVGWVATLIIAACVAAGIFSFVAYSPSVY